MIFDCGHCEHLERTSPAQVFLRCRKHCDNRHINRDVLRCHVQIDAPACEHYRERDRHDPLR